MRLASSLLCIIAVASAAHAEPLDRAALEACTELVRVGRRVADGATTNHYQADAEIRSAYRIAERSGDRELQRKLGAIIGGGKREVSDAYDYCANMVRTPSRPLSPREIDEQTRRAGEQSGSTKCATKVYGGGAAVTVCE